MAAGTARWFTRKNRSNLGATDPRRGLIRILGESQPHAVLRDQVESTSSDAATVRTELRCAGCGYGIVVSGSVPLCPMCQATNWEPHATG